VEFVRRLAALPAGRVAGWVLIAVWVGIGAAVTPLAFRLPNAENNQASSFLPADAESTRVIAAQRLLPGGNSVPAVVVLARFPKLRPADRAAAERIEAAVAHLSPSAPVRVTSSDGAEALISVGLAQSSDARTFTGHVGEIRAITRANTPPGAQAAVTGPAGLVTDTYDAISGIESTLLLVAAAVVAVTLLLVYRSPVLWLVPLGAVAIADQTATGATYLLARYAGLTVNAQSAGILRVLVFGAGTDYALLLIARYREELTRHEGVRDAMREALRRAGPALLASAATVVIGLLCLLLASLNSDRGLGPVGAVGIVCAFAAMTTLLPAGLVVAGRRLFWPFIPEFGSTPRDASDLWTRIAAAISHRPRAVWIISTLLLAGLATGIATLNTHIRQDQTYRGRVESVTGEHLIERSYPAGAVAPTYIVSRAGAVGRIRAIAAATPGVSAAVAGPASATGDLAQVTVILAGNPDDPGAYATVRRLREQVRAVPGADALVGGTSAVDLDIRAASVRDAEVIIPVVLIVIAIVLGLLLRAIVAPVLLIATVVVSFLAALGGSALAFRYVLGFPGSDPSLPLFGFIFLVALGIDYNIFLMTRVREEATRSDPRRGVRVGLAVTGGVITSAGAVLAATFSALLILPLVLLAEVGFLVAFGVLLDTFVVRSVLVPALALDLGPGMWWPSRLSRAAGAPLPAEPAAQEPAAHG
jgi:putative drug exporter of the RND superfamily